MELTQGERKKADPIPEKTHLGRCVGVFDLGKQYHTKYKKWSPKVIYMFEIPSVRAKFELEDGTKIDRPRLASRMYGKTLSDRGFLKPMLQAWRGTKIKTGETISLKDELGQPAAVQIVHNTKGENIYANIQSISELMEGVEPPDRETELMYFSFETHDDFESVETALAELPEWVGWITDKIRESQEYENIMSKSQGSGEEDNSLPEHHDDDDVPF